MTATVAVIGGGYGGITAAKLLDDTTDVVLVEPRETFVHNVAALRAVVDPTWIERLFLPYDQLLRHGRVVRDRAARVDTATVELGSGERIDADYVVLATGSSYPFPAKVDELDSTTARERLQTTHQALAGAESVLLLGAGPAGLELAGEIKSVWPRMSVSVVDPAEQLLGSTALPDDLRSELHRQLDGLGIELVLGTSLAEPPPSEAGEAKTFTAMTHSGRSITADLWFQCYGVVPTTGYLAAELARSRRDDGHLEVTAQLRLPGYEHVFAIGDITDVPETKMAKAAELHARVVADNIRTLVQGEGELSAHDPAPPGISLHLGATGGVSYAPPVGVLGPERTSKLKGAELRYGVYAKLLGIDQFGIEQ